MNVQMGPPATEKQLEKQLEVAGLRDPFASPSPSASASASESSEISESSESSGGEEPKAKGASSGGESTDRPPLRRIGGNGRFARRRVQVEELPPREWEPEGKPQREWEQPPCDWEPVARRCAEGILLAEELVRALRASRGADPDGDALEVCNGIVTEVGPDLEEELLRLAGVARGLRAEPLAAAVCELSLAIYQLRAWYCAGVGVVLLTLLERAALEPQRLPQQPSLAALRLLEGVVLICTVRHASRSVTQVLELMVRRKRVPVWAHIRLEAALVSLDIARSWPGVPAPVPLSEETECEHFLLSMANSLLPDYGSEMRMKLARSAVEAATRTIFPTSRVDYFGSAVNGFETRLSDLDVVVQISESDMAKVLEDMEREEPPEGPAGGEGRPAKLERRDAAKAASRHMGKRLMDVPELEDLGLEVKDVVTMARVPVLKCRSQDGILIDVSFDNTLPLHNSRLLRAYADLGGEPVRQLGRLIKLWAEKRRVNDALEGTLSSYSYTLMVIHFLQHVHALPNLQDKSLVPPGYHGSYGQAELLDGVHDVWFLDPARLAPDRLHLQAWKERCPEKVTLMGLLAGFFRYFAYEFPVHGKVVSIRHTQDVDKMEYFRSISEAKQALFANNTDDVVHGGAHLLADDEEEAAGEEALRAQRGERGLLLRAKLPQTEYHAQHHLSGRQVLCIDDPMELCRTLGASFVGMERLSYELRRACELTSSGCGERELAEVFSDDPPPARSIARLMEQHRVRSVLCPGNASVIQLSVPVPQRLVGRVIGRGGCGVQELQNIPGITSVWMVDALDIEDIAELRIAGSQEAVKACEARVRALLVELHEAQRRDLCFYGDARGARGRGWGLGRGRGRGWMAASVMEWQAWKQQEAAAWGAWQEGSWGRGYCGAW